MSTQPPIPSDPQPTETPVEVVNEAPDAQPEAKQINRRARLAFAGALLAELMFLLSALVPWGVSVVLSGISALLALGSMVTGFMALRQHPRNLAVAALVLSGVLIIIYLIVTIAYFAVAGMLK